MVRSSVWRDRVAWTGRGTGSSVPPLMARRSHLLTVVVALAAFAVPGSAIRFGKPSTPKIGDTAYTIGLRATVGGRTVRGVLALVGVDRVLAMVIVTGRAGSALSLTDAKPLLRSAAERVTKGLSPQ